MAAVCVDRAAESEVDLCYLCSYFLKALKMMEMS